jgi:hypothetical protein
METQTQYETGSTFEVRDTRTKNRFFVDNVIVDVYGSKLGPYGGAVYQSLCRHANLATQTSFPSHATIAKEWGIGAQKVTQMLRLLVELGLLRIESRYRKDGSQTSNLYILTNPPCLQESTPPSLPTPPLLPTYRPQVSDEPIPPPPAIYQPQVSTAGGLNNPDPEQSEEKEEGGGEVSQGPPAPADLNLAQVWQQCLVELRMQMVGPTFDQFFRGSRLVQFDPSTGDALIETITQYGADWIAGRWQKPVLRTLLGVTRYSVSLEEATLHTRVMSPPAPVPAQSPAPAPAQAEAQAEPLRLVKRAEEAQAQAQAAHPIHQVKPRVIVHRAPLPAPGP